MVDLAPVMVRFRMRDWWGSRCAEGQDQGWSGSGCIEAQDELWSGSGCVEDQGKLRSGCVGSQCELWSGGSVMVRIVVYLWSRAEFSCQNDMWGDLDSVVRETNYHMINIKLLNINFFRIMLYSY